MMKWRMGKTTVAVAVLVLGTTAWANKAKLGANIKEQLASDKITADGQKKVDGIDDKTQELLREYRMTLRKIENTKTYNDQLRKLIKSQQDEKKSLYVQTESIKVTNQEIVPLMISMVKTLDEMVKGDTPFLKEERTKRVEELKAMMDRADVSTSEKYRRILEAYQIENEYGKTLEAYRGNITRDGKELSVDFLRVGRLLLLYQTLDGRDQAVWDNNKQAWNELGSEYRSPIRDGLRIARKQTAPELLKLPLILSESAQ